jgi:hypothetical protein
MHSYLIALEENMARYKRSIFLTISFDPCFDKIYSPSGETIHPEIYRCPGCGVLPGWMGEGKPAHDRMVAEK